MATPQSKLLYTVEEYLAIERATTEKLRRFQLWNPTLTDFLLVSQTEPVIYHYLRQPAGGWLHQVYQGLAARTPIESIGCTLRLAEVYDRLVFPAEENPASATE